MNRPAQPRHRAAEVPPSGGAVVALWLITLLLSTVGWISAAVLLPMLVGWRPVVVVSGSMLPRIQPGDVVTVQPGTTDLQVGEVVTFRNPERPSELVTHRLARRDPTGGWQTQGDANATPDTTLLPEANIVGRPRLLVSGAGLLTYWRSSGQHGRLSGGLGGCLMLGVLITFTYRQISGPAAVRSGPPRHAAPRR